MNRDINLPNEEEEENAPLTVISFFPKYNDPSFINKKWLYSGDEKGVFRIYEILDEVMDNGMP